MHSEGGSSLGTGTPGGRYPAPPGTAPATKTVSTIYNTQYGMNEYTQDAVTDIYTRCLQQSISLDLQSWNNGNEVPRELPILSTISGRLI